MAKRKKKHVDDSAARALGEIERESDRIAEWIDENQMMLVGIVGAILVVAAIVGFATSGRESAREEAAASLAELQADYRVAMGAAPTAFEVAEPANPATALAVRTEYVDLFGQLAEENQGNTVGALAALDQSRIMQALGRSAEALATIDAAIAEGSGGARAQAYLQAARASQLEADARWADAAGAWEAAAAGDESLAAEWLASAARCWAEAGDRDKALAAWARFESLDSPVTIPPYVRARMEELEAGA